MNRSEAEIILELSREKEALMYGEFKLSAGGTSSYYFDARLLTLDPEGAYHVAKAIMPILKKCGAEAIAGPTIGADPIVSSIAVISHLEGNPIPGAIVRMSAKGYGGKRLIEGPIAPNSKVAVVDDTCTTGKNMLQAIESLESFGCQVVKVISILDRKEGGSREIKRRGYDFVTLLEANERGEITALPM